jgi:hypothetical protein
MPTTPADELAGTLIRESLEEDCGLDPGGLGEDCTSEIDTCPECEICIRCGIDGHDEGCTRQFADEPAAGGDL